MRSSSGRQGTRTFFSGIFIGGCLVFFALAAGGDFSADSPVARHTDTPLEKQIGSLWQQARRGELGEICKMAHDSFEESHRKEVEQRHRQEAERQRAKWEEEEKGRRLERETQQKLNYEKQKSLYEEALKNKDRDPKAYMAALLRFAIACREVKLDAQGEALFYQALKLFKECEPKDKFGPVADQAWQYLKQYIGPQKFDQVFKDLITAAERNPANSDRDLDRNLRSTIDLRPTGPSTPEFDKRAAWKTVVDVTTKVRGKNDPSLENSLRPYAYACMNAGDFDTAERALLQIKSLLPAQAYNKQIWLETELARFYVEHGQFSKADAAWRQCFEMGKADNYRVGAQSLAAIAQAYKRQSQPQAMQNMIDAALQRGGEALLKAFDPQLTELVESYIAKGSLEKAEALLKRRIEASSTCADDQACNDWQIQLSDVYAAEGKLKESKQLFDKALGVMALQGYSTEGVRARRRQLLERLGLPDQGEQSRDRNAPKSSKPINLRFGLFAVDSIRFGNNTRVYSCDSSHKIGRAVPSPILPGSRAASVCSLKFTEIEGNFDIAGTVYGQLRPAGYRLSRRWSSVSPLPKEVALPEPPLIAPADAIDAQRAYSASQRTRQAPQPSRSEPIASEPHLLPPVLAPPPRPSATAPPAASGLVLPPHPPPVPTPPPVSLPPFATIVSHPLLPPPPSPSSLSAAGRSADLCGPDVDYVRSSLQGLMMLRRGRTRIFIVDEPGDKTLKLPSIANPNQRPRDFQIWYAGTRTITVRHANAVIYAPNATVVLEFNGDFTGAIVANRIIGKGNNRFLLDTSLLTESFE